jgi:hypothetical protein
MDNPRCLRFNYQFAKHLFIPRSLAASSAVGDPPTRRVVTVPSGIIFGGGGSALFSSHSDSVHRLFQELPAKRKIFS